MSNLEKNRRQFIVNLVEECDYIFWSFSLFCHLRVISGKYLFYVRFYFYCL